ncbi:hypothetical protein ACIQUL_29355 [Streptomyces sp. NPDC090303]|uniref:hypothetical protein n=1 Tax=Streptomyces sp. NPDC090303 TaxID=3365960 RepID=UPI00380168BA
MITVVVGMRIMERVREDSEQRADRPETAPKHIAPRDVWSAGGGDALTAIEALAHALARAGLGGGAAHVAVSAAQTAVRRRLGLPASIEEEIRNMR